MGFDLKRITTEVDEELKCGICRQLLENPVILSDCDHIFCGKCLDSSLSKSMICPIDRKYVTKAQIKSAPKLFQNFITKFEISCDYMHFGCKTLVKVDKLSQHIISCPFRHFNRSRETATSSCVEEMSQRLESLEMRIKCLENENQSIRKQLEDIKRLLNWDLKKQIDPKNSFGKILIKIDDKNLIVDADIKESIERIKQRVQKLEGMEAEELLVFFANQELDQNRCLSDYRINKLSNLLFLSMIKKKIKISVKIDREREYEIEVSPKDRVKEVVPKVLRPEVIDTNEVVITYRNQQLDENRSLFSYKIRDGNYIFLNTKPKITQTLHQTLIPW